MDKKKIAIILGIVCLVLTICICVQIKTIENSNKTVAKTFTENSLREEATKDDTGASEKEKQISLNNNLLGITNLVGQGVEITIKDDPNATRENIGILEDISSHIVHDADLRFIVNELKNAGAEAISINGQRLVNTTAITCIGNVIQVNDERITSPFVIKAIGFPESLAGVDRPGGYIELLKEKGIVVNIKKVNSVEIPKYTGVISAKYMNVQK